MIAAELLTPRTNLAGINNNTNVYVNAEILCQTTKRGHQAVVWKGYWLLLPVR